MVSGTKNVATTNDAESIYSKGCVGNCRYAYFLYLNKKRGEIISIASAVISGMVLLKHKSNLEVC